MFMVLLVVLGSAVMCYQVVHLGSGSILPAGDATIPTVSSTAPRLSPDSVIGEASVGATPGSCLPILTSLTRNRPNFLVFAGLDPRISLVPQSGG